MSDILTIPLDAIVEHPDQPRYSAGDVATLAESIKSVGQLDPIIVAPVSGGPSTTEQWRIISGHRRVVALRSLGWETAQAVPLYGLEQVAELQALMATNVVREALTSVEEARGYQTMLDLGMNPKAIARATGRDRKQVVLLAGAMKDLSAEKARAIHDHQCSVEEMLALHDLAGDEERYAKLLKLVGKPNFAQQAEWLRSEAERDAWEASTRDSLAQQGVPILDGDVMYRPIKYLVDENGEELTPETHADCPGHAARIDRWGQEVIYCCTDAQKHDNKPQDVEPYVETPEQIAEREARASEDAAWEAAATVRRAFLTDLLKRKEIPAGYAWWAVNLLWSTAYEYTPSYAALNDLAKQLLGWDADKSLVWSSDRHGLPSNIDGDKPTRALIALMAASFERDLGIRCMRADDKGGQLRRYLLLLVEQGYALSDVERELVQKAEKEAPEEAEEETAA